MKVVIIGGVAGGAGAAARLRRNNENIKIVMLEKGEYISFANCGLPYYIGGVIKDKSKLQLQTPASFGKRFNIDVRVQNEVIAVDDSLKRILVQDHKQNKQYWETYDKLIISSGSTPIRPNMPGADLPHVFTLRNIPDTYKIKDYLTQHQVKKAAVIGGGYIGLEMAENLKHSGCEVSIIEAASHLVGSLDDEVAAHLHNYVRTQDIALYLDARAAQITPEEIILADGSKVSAELVIMSIGVRADTGFLRDSKVERTQYGEIIVDDKLQTNVADVYAVGDAIVTKNIVAQTLQNIPLASPANKQARIVADVICGSQSSYKGSQGTAILKFFDLTVAVTGECERRLQQLGISYKKSYTYSPNHATYYPGADSMFIKLLYTYEGKILGAQIIGTQGVDKRIDVFATAVRNKLTVREITELELAYAPPFGSAKDPVNMAAYVAENYLVGKSEFFFLEDLDCINAEDILLDVRSGGEFAAGHLEGAINIPLDDLRNKLDLLDMHKKIYIYCGIGLRGYLSQCILRQNGFKHTYNLSGGYELYSAYLLDKNNRKKSS